MEFQKNTPEQCHVGNLLEKGEAVIFCGAGISVEPPAGLPDWHKLRDYTLEEVASRDNKLASYLEDLTSITMMASPGKKGLTPEIVASQIMRLCRGYFESFSSLEDSSPNANHRYLAKLAQDGHLRYIVTTNFDLQTTDEKHHVVFHL